MFFKKKYTPHGKEFSFIDKFVHNKNTGITWKYIDPSFFYLRDHFPGNPIVPGIFLIECAAQCAGALWPKVNRSLRNRKQLLFLSKIENFKILLPVYPDSTIQTTVTLNRDFTKIALFECKSQVNGEVVSTGKIIMSSAVK